MKDLKGFLQSKNHRKIFRFILFSVCAVELLLLSLTISGLSAGNILSKGNLGNVESAVLSDLTNTERKANNEPVLVVSPLLNKAAQLKADDMARNSYFSHTSPDGKTPWYWFAQVGYKYKEAGENLAINFGESKDVTNAWMNSPAHRANIVKENYTEVGTGIATGTYEGVSGVFIVQLYGKPLESVVTTTPPLTNINLQENSKEKNSVVTNKKVLGESITVKIESSPRNYFNQMCILIMIGIVLVLFTVFILKIKNRHPKLVMTSVLLLIFLTGVCLLNIYIGNTSTFVGWASQVAK